MIVLHFGADRKLVGIRNQEEKGNGAISSIPKESVDTLTFDPATNPTLRDYVITHYNNITYVGNKLRNGVIQLTVAPDSQDQIVIRDIKSKVLDVLTAMRNGSATFNADTQKVLFYLLKSLLKETV